ncbi:helix-turn-helix transcriptional regulator [Streptomyces sp. Z26]|uniref:helix-turn-helix transcriptional regulator n=1 Tax=Streptomyces sp. Z26 TaxID=2500177 RepID=UPI000EF1678B|nr:helix-turn-helix transcriptional regulator [Streptomyces sp. Z26]RLL68252.1 LuxR family transcriptional regulator [Streptomyces sp. Z26]
MFVERAEILDHLDGLLRQSAQGRGTVAAISGLTAMGKTTVLDALADRATEAGSTVLRVVSSPQERHVPYDTLTQLLTSVDTRTPDTGVPGVGMSGHGGTGGPEGTPIASLDARDDSLEVAKRAHRIISELAAERHLLIAVDDIQYTDAATLTCLRYLAQRLGQLPVALVFTHGTPVEGQPSQSLQDFLYQTNVRRFHLGPLSSEGIRELVECRVPSAASDRFISEVHALSGGNPLLVQALVEERGLRPVLESVNGSGTHPATDVVARTSPDGLSPGHAFHQAVLSCLHRLGPRAVRIARCVALLDEAATPSLVSQLSAIDAELVARYLRLLTSTGVLDGARLRREDVRQAVLTEMPHDKATELRYHAARLLHESGAPAHAVAAHLLSVDPLHEDWVVPVLQEAACHALAHGDMQFNIRCLELARECRTDETGRASVLAHYAFGQWQLRPADSAQHFMSLKRPIMSRKLPGPDAVRIAEGMMFHLDFDSALEVVDQVNDGEDDDTSTALEGTRLFMVSEFLGVLDRPRLPLPKVAPSATSTAELRSRHALALALERGADEYAIALAEQVLQGSRTQSAWQLMGMPAALMTLCYTDQLDSAAKWYEILGDEKHRYDAPAWQGMLESAGALIALRSGQLSDAARRAESAYEQLSGSRWNTGNAFAVALLVEAHTAMGNHEIAAKYLAPEPPSDLFLTRTGLHYLYARGGHHLATGNPRMALSDFLACGALMRRWNIDTPTVAPWRLGEAEAWLKLGERDRAVRAVEEQRARSDSGPTRSRGMTLHSWALVQPTVKQPSILRDAFRLLESTGARYEAATVLADLSHVYHELGEKARARQTARRAWRLVKSCGAEARYQSLLPTSLPRSVISEQKTGPSAPPRADQDAFGQLSASERRVATLATQGYANREIADKLFITVSTVEQHLTRVYRKMGVRNREQLLEAHAVSYKTA